MYGLIKLIYCGECLEGRNVRSEEGKKKQDIILIKRDRTHKTTRKFNINRWASFLEGRVGNYFFI